MGCVMEDSTKGGNYQGKARRGSGGEEIYVRKFH